MDDTARQRLIQLLGMTGSAFDGEAVNALRRAQAVMREHKIDWHELIERPAHELAIATEACQKLLRENEILRAAVARAVTQRTAVALGNDDHCRQAQRLLHLHEAGDIELTEFETDFLDTISGWDGPLTERQAPVFSRILRRYERIPL